MIQKKWDLDFSNGTSKGQYSPTEIFFENEVTEKNKDKFLKLVLDAIVDLKEGYLIKCDLEYLQKTHSAKQKFPLGSEKKQ